MEAMLEVDVFWVVTPCSEDGGRLDLRNIGFLQHYTALQPRIPRLVTIFVCVLQHRVLSLCVGRSDLQHSTQLCIFEQDNRVTFVFMI
jgi:hypothetical protein